MTSASGPAAASGQPSGATAHPGRHSAKRIIWAMVILNIAAFAPALVLGSFGWTQSITVVIPAGLATFMACATGSGWRTGLRLVIPFSLFTLAVVQAAPYAWAAAIVMAAAAFWRGYGARLGLHNALLMTVISLGFLVSAPPAFTGAPLPASVISGVLVLITSLYVTAVMYLARKWIHQPPLTALVTARVLTFSSVLAIVVGAVTWGVVHYRLGHGGAWIILTILVVFQPYLGVGFAKAGQRVMGTALGFVIALGIGLVFPTGGLLYAIGMVLMIVAASLLMLGRPYWVFVMFLTPAVVLFESSGTTVDQEAVVRIESTGIGVAIALLVMLALTPVAKHLQHKAGSPRF